MNRDNDPSALDGFEGRLLQELTELDRQRTDSTGAPAPARRPWRRPAVLAMVVTAALVGASAAAAAALFGQPTFQAAGQTVVAGDSFIVKGSGCATHATVGITMDGTIDLATATADADGLFIAEPTVPVNTKPGSHTVTASCDRGSSGQLRQELVVDVTDRHEPLTAVFAVAGAGTPGGQVVVKGAGCRPGTDVTFRLDGSRILATAVATSDGGYDGLFGVPEATTIGSHTLEAACAAPGGGELRLSGELLVVAAQPEPPDRKAPTSPTPPG